MQNAAPLYCTIKKIQRFEDRVIWRCYGRFSRTITRDYAVFFSRGEQLMVPATCPFFPGVLRYAEVCKAWGTLILPARESSPFWPLLCPNGQACFCRGPVFESLPLLNSLFYPGESGHVLFQGGMPNSAVYALRINLSGSKPIM